MYKVLFIISALSFFSCKAQESSEINEVRNQNTTNEKVENSGGIDDGYKEQILAMFRVYRKSQSAAIQEKELNLEMGKVTDLRLQDVKQLIIEFTKREPNLLSDKFLSKPSQNTMQAIYHIEKVGIKSFTPEKVDLKTFINKGVETISELELLVKYYKILFSRNNRMGTNRNFSSYNIDFDKLGLKTSEEKNILFLISMSVFGRKYERQANRDCAKAKAYMEFIPKFKGKYFYECRLEPFNDFMITIDRNRGLGSFNTFYSSIYNKTISAYNNCN